MERARRRDGRVVSLGALTFFSTETGDAWLLDRADSLALCLALNGQRRRYSIMESSTRFAIEWTGTYEISEDAFVFADSSGEAYRLLGYPVEEIRRAP